MRNTAAGVLFMLLAVHCGGNGGDNLTPAEPPLSDVLTLELSFGDEDLPDEYLLASPRTRFAVRDNGDFR